MLVVRRPGLGGLVLGLLLTTATAAPAAVAGGGGPCEYASVPANSQARGQQVTVSGTFGEQHQNGTIQVRLRTGGTDYTLAPNGTTDGTGAFEHSVTIPASTPIGDYDLITVGPGPPDNPVICSKPFSVTQGGGFATPTTGAPTTTLAEAAPTTTAAAPPTTSLATTTTQPATTTTNVDDLVAAEDTEEGEGTLIWLAAGSATALIVAIAGFLLGRRSRP